MQIAMLGLGRMGANMAQRLLRGGHKVVVYDVDPRRATELPPTERRRPPPWTR